MERYAMELRAYGNWREHRMEPCEQARWVRYDDMNELTAKCDELRAERDELRAERDELRAERDELVRERRGDEDRACDSGEIAGRAAAFDDNSKGGGSR